MKHLFYFMTVFPILWEMGSLVEMKKVQLFSKRLKNTKSSDLTKKQSTFYLLHFGYIIWNFIGFFTFQWSLFLGLFLLALIPKNNNTVRRFDSLLSLMILVFIVLNAYHFKIDIWTEILNFFNNK